MRKRGMSKRKQPTIDKPLTGKRVRYCTGERPIGDYALKTFRRLGGKVVQKGPADILVIDHYCAGMVLTDPPRWMNYAARSELAEALAEAEGAGATYDVMSVSGFHEYMLKVNAERRAAVTLEMSRRQDALQSTFFAQEAPEAPPSFVGF